MSRVECEQVLVRIFIAESDEVSGKPLYQAIINTLKEEKIAGATVLRGVLGYGSSSKVHASHLLSISQDMPMVIEAVDSEESIQKVLPKIKEMVEEGFITLEKVHVIQCKKD